MTHTEQKLNEQNKFMFYKRFNDTHRERPCFTQFSRSLAASYRKLERAFGSTKIENPTVPYQTGLSEAIVKVNRMGSTIFIFFENFVSVYEPLIKNWFDGTTAQIF